jgi:PHP family Zn ribbon phosphoesterase
MAPRVPLDLHIHTALSPCAAAEMKPAEILLTAERAGLAVVGLVDHGSAGNAGAALRAAPAFEPRVLVGIEAESTEGVHLLALFDTLEAVADLETVLAAHMPDLPNRPKVLGEQQLVDEWGEVRGVEDRLLVTATDLGVEEIADLTRARGGLCIPAHIDRSVNGLLPLLGFLPPRLEVDLLEVSSALTPEQARERWPELAGRALVTGSDAHCLQDVGRAVTWIPPEFAQADLEPKKWGEAVARELLRA